MSDKGPTGYVYKDFIKPIKGTDESEFYLHSINDHSTITDYKSSIIHRIDHNQMVFAYGIIFNEIILISCIYRKNNGQSPTFFQLKWDENKIFTEVVNGSISVLKFCRFKSWEDYFHIKEISAYLMEKYNIDTKTISYYNALTKDSL